LGCQRGGLRAGMTGRARIDVGGATFLSRWVRGPYGLSDWPLALNRDSCQCLVAQGWGFPNRFRARGEGSNRLRTPATGVAADPRRRLSISGLKRTT
jgi:hypothetical protein